MLIEIEHFPEFGNKLLIQKFTFYLNSDLKLRLASYFRGTKETQRKRNWQLSESWGSSGVNRNGNTMQRENVSIPEVVINRAIAQARAGIVFAA